MLERRSPLSGKTPFESDSLRMHEMAGFSLMQLSGLTRSFEKDVAAAIGKIPGSVGASAAFGSETLFRIGPSQIWIAGRSDYELPKDLALRHAAISLSHSRARVLIEGAAARDLLSKGIALDFHRTAFKPNDFAMTGLDHTPVTVHCIGENAFHLYALSTFAVSVWHWLTDAALEFGDHARA
jgi:sarcosine oxidase subunit gamma